MNTPSKLGAVKSCCMNAHSDCCNGDSDSLASTRFKARSSNVLSFWSDTHVWRIASRNTLNCLIGCMIGDIGVLIYFQVYYPNAPMWLTMVSAMAAGLVTSVLFESTMLKWKEGLTWKAAFFMAFSMSFLSMVGMELAANATDFMLTGGRVALSDPYYWKALAISVVAGFLTPLPYNYWKFKKHGKACH